MRRRNASGGGVIIGLIVIIGAIVALFVSHHSAPGIFKFLAWIVAIVIAIIIALIILIIVLARKSSKRDAEQKKAAGLTVNKEGLTADQALIINKGRSDLVAIRMVSSRINNKEIKKAMTNVSATTERILVTLKEKPETIKSARQFTHYYLPTLREVLERYHRIELSGVDEEGMGDKVVKYLADVQKALDKQYSNLFDGDKFDMSVDMEAMTIALKRDGLIDADYQPEPIPPEEPEDVVAEAVANVEAAAENAVENAKAAAEEAVDRVEAAKEAVIEKVEDAAVEAAEAAPDGVPLPNLDDYKKPEPVPVRPQAQQQEQLKEFDPENMPEGFPKPPEGFDPSKKPEGFPEPPSDFKPEA